MRPRGFVADPFGVVAGGDQQGRGGVDTDAVTGEQRGCGLRDEPREDLVDVVHVVADRERASAEGPHREFRGVQDRVTVRSRAQSRSPLREVGFGDVSELFPQAVGAGEAKWRIWLRQRARAWRPERCATSNARIASTFPSPVFAMPDARPDNAARAASIASTGSDLPCMRRSWRLVRSTSITTSPHDCRYRERPAPYAPVPSIPTRATGPNPHIHSCNATNPTGFVANDSTPRTPPFASSAAAT